MPRALLVLGRAAGGMASHVRLLAEHLPAEGWDVALAAPNVTLRALGHDGTCLDLGERPRLLWDLRCVLQLRRLARMAGADVIHAHGLRAAGLCGLALGLRPPLLVTLHNVPAESPTAAILLRMAKRRTRTWLAVSEAVREGLRERLPGADALVCRNALGPEWLAPPRVPDMAQTELGWMGGPHVLFLGRMTAEKGLDLLVDAWPRILVRHPNARLWIAGDGPLRDGLASQLPMRATMLGHRDDAPYLVTAADLVVVSSRSEGEGLVALEALATGTPVVAAAVGGLPDVLRGGEFGLLAPPNDPGSLAEAVSRALADLPAQRARAAAGGALVRVERRPETLARSVSAHYERLRTHA
jgi:glycosyltransferase involved in cell wall biosynthesis